MAITLRGDGDTTFDNNIGIGTTAPDEALHVHATGSTQIAAEFQASNNETYIQFTGNDSTQVLYGRDSADACIQVNANDVFKAKSGGDCQIVDGNLVLANSHGINFSPQGASNVNLLDDYEEGTFTPVVRFGGNESGQSYSEQAGHYTKVGRLVVCSILISMSNKGSSTGSATIANLPFTSPSQSQARGAGHFTYQTDMSSLDSTPIAYMLHNTSETKLIDHTATTNNDLTEGNFTNSSVFRAYVTYYSA